MNTPLVSVLVPVYRVERYIERCVRSLFEQTYQNLEYVFVDDATDDASIDILRRVMTDYPERCDSVKIIRHDSNKGLAAARNTAVASCRGDFVTHVDSDDWMITEAIELLVKKQQETDADIVTAEAYDYLDGEIKNHASGGWNLDKDTLLKGLLTYRLSTSLWRRLIRRNLYSDHHVVCDERGSGGEDFQVFPQLVYYAKKVSGINDKIYYYNKSNRKSISNNAESDIAIQIQGMVSVMNVVSFFSDKESCLYSLVAGMDVRTIHYRMNYNASKRNREGYFVFLNYMKASDTRYWSQVRWNHPFVRCIEGHYYTMLLKNVFRHLLYKAKELV